MRTVSEIAIAALPFPCAIAGRTSCSRPVREPPRRGRQWRRFAWKSRFRRLVRDYERRKTVLAGLHLVAVASLELARAVPLLWLHRVPNSS